MSEAAAVKESQSPQTPKTKKLVQGKLFFKSSSSTKANDERKTVKESHPAEVVVIDDDDEPCEVNEKDVETASDSEDENKSPAGSSAETEPVSPQDGEEVNEHVDAQDREGNSPAEDVSSTPSTTTPSTKKTPKRLVKEEERKRKMEEKLKEKEEKERKKAEEREERERKKAEEKAEREKAKKEKLEEKQKQKQAEKEAKAEEKRRKEEAKEAEKKKKEEEKLKAEEEERKKLEKTAQVFTSFFTPKRPPASKNVEATCPVSNNLAFVPFQVKENMRLAPLVRTDFTSGRRDGLDDILRKNGESSRMTEDYLSSVKTMPTGKSGPTWPADQQQPADVEIIDEEEDGAANDKENIVMTSSPAIQKKQRAKLLQFHENRRPPYWGTWRKKSASVTPRRPFARDAAFFDYEVDSDDEWEEEEPGESLTDSEGEDKEPNNEDDYEVDNEFFVPHGYLSDEEGQEDEEERALSPSVAKERLKLKEEEFEQELKKKMSQLKPSLIGCIWQNDDQPQLLKVLQQYAAIVCTAMPIVVLPEENDLLDTSMCSVEDSGKAEKTKRRVQDKDMPDLIRMVHGSVHGRAALVQEFLQHLERTSGQNGRPSKAQISLKIQEVAQYTKCSQQGPMSGKTCWLVKDEFLRQYHLDTLSVVNTWHFSSDPKKRGRKPDEAKVDDENTTKQTNGVEASCPRVSLITKFTQSETPQQAKKRVTLTPVTPTAAKKPKVETTASPLAGFLQRFKNSESKNDGDGDDDDCVALD